jgi:iron complex outermembrane receptor protein
MTFNHRRQILAWSIATALGAVAMVPVLAQDAPASTGNATTTKASDKNQVTTLNLIVVHAQKRVEYLQDVPVTMATLNKQQLHDAGVHDIKDLQLLVPDLAVSSSDNSANTTARIRGIGTIGDNAGLESSVGIVIDGVPRARNGVGFGDLGELDQIEVLKGPQGTVFGKNTSAGVINITTQRPTFQQEGYLDLTGGNYSAYGIDASYNNKLSDNVAFRLYAVDRKHDGYNDVFVGNGPRTDKKDADQDFHSFRGQLLIRPSETVDITLIGDYTQHNENCCGSVTVQRGPVVPLIDAFSGGPGQGVIAVPDPSKRLEYTNASTKQKITDEGVSAEVNWITPWLNSATLTSITSVRKYTLQAASDLDFTAADLATHNFGPQNGERFNTFTQELHLTGSTDHVDWLGGVYFDHVRAQRSEEIDEQAQYEGFLSALLVNGLAAALPPGYISTANPQNFFSEITGLPYGTTYSGIGQRDMWNQTSKSTAAFGNVTWHLTDALALTAGVRYTHEQKQTDFIYTNPNGGLGCGAAITTNGVADALAARGVPAPVIPLLAPTVIGNMCLPWENPLFNGLTSSDKFTENEWSGTLKAAYRWNDNFLTYLSGARGYKAGGFNLARVQSATGMADGSSGIIPVTNTQFPGEFVNSFELGTKTTWADGDLLLNAALFHAKYTHYQLNLFSGISWNVDSIPELTTKGVDVDMLWQTKVPGLSLQAAATYNKARFGSQVPLDPVLVDLPNSVASYAPKWAASAGIAYQWNFSGNVFGRFNVNAKYSSTYNASGVPGPEFFQPAYTLVDARFTIGGVNKKWNVELWGHNLTNRTYAQVLYPPALQTGSVNAFLAAPRTFGATLHLAL